MLAAGPQFRPHPIADDLRGGYQVVAADLNRDGRPDLIALASGMTDLVWFENPTWERHVLASGLKAPINLAAADLDGDGIPEIILGSDFAMDPRKSAGTVSVLKCAGDPRAPWTIKEIDRLPSTHRLRWANIDGKGRVAINAPLAGAAAVPPEYKATVPLVYYRPGSWRREAIPEPLEGVLHGIQIVDFDGDGRDEILTASFLGIHLFKLSPDGAWSRTELAKGSPERWPHSGTSDAAVGRLAGRKFICSIEPWHGNEVVVYFETGGKWTRQAIDNTLVDGHALLVADLDGDGQDEIVAGYRGQGRSVNVYRALDPGGTHWLRTALDEGGMGAASCAVADLNRDGKPDLACIDDHQLKWYENVTPR